MIVGIGTDIIEISRVKKAVSKSSFLNKVYTDNEQKLFNGKNYNTLAGNFAVKEAVSKALGTGFSSISPKDIEVLRDLKGKPYVLLYNNANKISKTLNIKKIHVSISHSIEYAIAYVIAEEEIKIEVNTFTANEKHR